SKAPMIATPLPDMKCRFLEHSGEQPYPGNGSEPTGGTRYRRAIPCADSPQQETQGKAGGVKQCCSDDKTDAIGHTAGIGGHFHAVSVTVENREQANHRHCGGDGSENG